MRPIRFLLPGTTGRFRGGGLLVELQTARLTSQLTPTEVVTYRKREPDHPFLDDLLARERAPGEALWIVSWGFDVPRLLGASPEVSLTRDPGPAGLVFLIRQPKIRHEIPKRILRWDIRDIRFLSIRFWLLMVVITILMLARFSEAFLNLQAKSVGWEIAMLPLLFVAYELVHAVVAYPMGRLTDKVNRKKLLLLGMGVLIIANIFLITATSWKGALLGVMTVGLHMGMTQGLISAMIADEAPADLRGTAFALYYFFIGCSVMIGNVIAGWLSDKYCIQGCFYGGAVFTTVAALALALMIKHPPSSKRS